MSAKKALLTSILALLVSITMLVGTTFAWFTDSVTSGTNRIVNGNLDVEVYHSITSVPTGTSAEKVSPETKMFEVPLWEPGMVVYENVLIKNEGTLALKYNIALNVSDYNTVTVNGVTHDLSEVLKVSIVPGGWSGSRAEAISDLTFNATISDFIENGYLLPEGSVDELSVPTDRVVYGIVVYWAESAADSIYNINNGKSTSDGQPLFIELGLNVIATQKDYEEDSFGPDYDESVEHEHVYTLLNSGTWRCSYCPDIYENTGAPYVMVLGEQGTAVPTTAVALNANNSAALAELGVTVNETLNGPIISYDTSSATTGKTVIIKTAGGDLYINAPLDTVYRYGNADNVYITAVANASYHEYGKVGDIVIVGKGHVEISPSAIVEDLSVAKNAQQENVSITITGNPVVETIAVYDAHKSAVTINNETVDQMAEDENVVIIPDGKLARVGTTLYDTVGEALEKATDKAARVVNDEITSTSTFVTQDKTLKVSHAVTLVVLNENNVVVEGSALLVNNGHILNDKEVAGETIGVKIVGTLVNNGQITNQNGQVIENDGVIVNNNTITNQGEGSKIQNNADATMENNKQMDNKPGAEIVNEGSFVVNDIVNNEGVVTSTESATITIDGVFDNKEGASLVNEGEITVTGDTGIVDNGGDYSGTGSVETVDQTTEEEPATTPKLVNIGSTFFESFAEVAEYINSNNVSGKTINFIEDVETDVALTLHGVNNVTVKLNGKTFTSTANYAVCLYDCDGVTFLNGTVYGQFRIGERKSTIIKWKHLNYGDDLYEAVYGYHPLAPAKNIVLNNLTVDSGDLPVFFYTNIEEDLVRGAPSNYCDNDIYGRYIYKTGYTNKDQYVNNAKDEVFTACSDKDSVTVIGGTYRGAAFTGNMVTYGGELIDGVLTVTEGTVITTDGAGRFIEGGYCLVGTANNAFTVTDTVPANYVARVGEVYYTYEGAANDAIKFARIGETVYIAENADAVKEIAQGESFTVVSLVEGVSWTGAAVTTKVENPSNFEIIETADELNPLIKVYTVQFAVIARVYHLGDTRQTIKANTTYDEYGSLIAAVEAAGTGDYVMLMKDTTISDESSISSSYVKYGINLSARMVLDLNGYTYTYTGSGTAIICTANTGTDGGQRAIRDTSAGQTGTVYATNGYAFAKYNQKSEKTVIYGGNFVSDTTYPVWIKAANVFEIQGGRFVSQTTYAVSVDACTTFNITGGYFEGPSYWLNKASSVTPNITGGTFVPEQDAIHESSSCFAEGTMITLADGTQKAIENVTYQDKILAWDFFAGDYSEQGIAILVNHGTDTYKVVTLNFSDETALKIIGDHGIFDIDLNEFVYLDAYNYADYVGHNFVKVAESGYTTVALESAAVTVEEVAAYSITSAGTSNAFAEGLLTVAPPKEFYNWIEMSDTLKYDADKFAEDVETYGLYTYEDFAAYITEDVYEAFNGQYLKIPVEKGIFTFEYIVELISLYGEFFA